LFDRSLLSGEETERGRMWGDGEMDGALQEVVHGSAGWVGILLVRDSVKLLELAVALVVEGKDGGDVSAAVAVVGRRPDGHQLLVKHVFVSLLDELVSAGDEFELVLLHKLWTKQRKTEENARVSG